MPIPADEHQFACTYCTYIAAEHVYSVMLSSVSFAAGFVYVVPGGMSPLAAAVLTGSK